MDSNPYYNTVSPIMVNGLNKGYRTCKTLSRPMDDRSELSFNVKLTFIPAVLRAMHIFTSRFDHWHRRMDILIFPHFCFVSLFILQSLHYSYYHTIYLLLAGDWGWWLGRGKRRHLVSKLMFCAVLPLSSRGPLSRLDSHQPSVVLVSVLVCVHIITICTLLLFSLSILVLCMCIF